MLINLSEVFTLEGKERTWTVPLEMRSYEGADGKYPVASSEPCLLYTSDAADE